MILNKLLVYSLNTFKGYSYLVLSSYIKSCMCGLIDTNCQVTLTPLDEPECGLCLAIIRLDY